MIKLLIICPVFFEKNLWKRWRLLTELYSDIDVTLLAPLYWRWGESASYSTGKIMIAHGISYESERFRVKVINMPKIKKIGWIAPRFPLELMLNKPDMVYYIGHDMENALTEIIIATKIFAHKAKIAAFTMRGIPHDFRSPYVRLKWNIIKKYCNAIFCHYPEAKKLIKSEGFNKPIYIQTQVGVDASYYTRNEEARKKIRKLYGLEDAFVFGSASRITRDKGLIEILNALPINKDCKYLMLGSGPKEEELMIREEIMHLGLTEQVILTGFIDRKEMPNYFSSMDCFVHVPKTTKKWIDTFPLAVIEAMASSLPIIVNDSGAMQYQVGSNGIVVPEGSIDYLRNAMEKIMATQEKTKSKGSLLRERVLKSFDIEHLAKCFNATMRDILNNKYDVAKEDQALISKY